MGKNLVLRAIAVVTVLLSSTSYAATTTYSDQASFFAALPGPSSTLTFDSTANGAIVSSGDSLEGITFFYNIGQPPIDMMVTNDFLTTSGSNYLGLDDPGNYNLFIAGDTFSMTFDNPTNALGMYFVSGDPLFDNDIELVTDIGSAFTSSVVDISLADGGIAYYVGLISDTAFSSASIQFAAVAEGTFLYNVDDITTSVSAVPIPGSIWLFGSGLISLVALNKRRN